MGGWMAALKCSGRGPFARFPNLLCVRARKTRAKDRICAGALGAAACRFLVLCVPLYSRENTRAVCIDKRAERHFVQSRGSSRPADCTEQAFTARRIQRHAHSEERYHLARRCMADGPCKMLQR